METLNLPRTYYIMKKCAEKAEGKQAMFDYHMHSKFSYDGAEELSAMINSAAIKGLQEVCFTEHMDIALDDMPQTPLDMSMYTAAYKEAIKNAPIPVKFGVELGPYKEKIDAYKAFSDAYDFDFVILSQHIIENDDPYLARFYDRFTVKQAYELYLQNMLTSMRHIKKYSVLGHIGYVTRYHNNWQKEPFDYATYGDYIDAIYKMAIAEGKGIELNTSYMHTPVGGHPPVDMLRCYKQLGGEIITTGSDAHLTNEIGANFEEAYALLKELGFRYVCTFANMQPAFHKI